MSGVRSRQIGVILGSSQLEGETGLEGLADRLQATARELTDYAHEALGIPGNDFLGLFNDPRSPTEQLDAIRLWIADKRLAADAPVSLFLFFVGHGAALSDKDARMAVRRSRPDSSGDALLHPDDLSSTLVSALPLSSRYFLYLDCCYARTIGDAMTFRPRSFAQDGVLSRIDLPVVDGVVYLAATDHDLKAFSPPGSPFTRMSTMFFASLGAYSPTLLTFDQVHQQMLQHLAEKENRGEWDRSNTTRPMLVAHKNDRTALTHEAVLPAGWRTGEDDFDPNFDPDCLSVLVVCRERGSEGLFSAVADTLIGYAEEIERASGKKVQGSSLLDVRDAFSSPEAFKKRLTAICRADIVFFDATGDDKYGIEPGVMVLMGVRSVARRGVSICSVDQHPDQMFSIKLPYNLQYLNIASHADMGGTLTRSERICRKIEQGFEDYYDSPDYLDLPTYDAIRELGITPSRYAPQPFYMGPLYLGPFHGDVIGKCFPPLERALCAHLRPLVDKNRTGRAAAGEVRVKRLLDDSATKLVGLTLYESIRRYEFCLIDWTLLRPNVFFEFGVRLAAAPKGAVHVMADIIPPGGRQQPETAPNRLGVHWPSREGNETADLKHVVAMHRLFPPIIYRDERHCRESAAPDMIARFHDSTSFFSDDDQYYQTIAKAIPPPANSALTDAIDVIDQRAKYNYIHGEDALRVTSLHADINPDLAIAAMSRALAFHLAETFLRVVDRQSQDAALRIAEIENLLERELRRRRGAERDVEALARGLDLLKQIAGS